MSAPGGVHESLPVHEVLLDSGLHVRRLLPGKTRRLVGPWCYLDHFGPDTFGPGETVLRPHPHLGAQALSWLLEGRLLHRDGLGGERVVAPGELMALTSGTGTWHAEGTPKDGSGRLRGLRLWLLLPELARRSLPPQVHHVVDVPTYAEAGVTLRVLAGTLVGETSPVPAYQPAVAAEVSLAPGSHGVLPLEAGFEHAVLVLDGEVVVGGRPVAAGELAYLGADRAELEVSSGDGSAPTSLLLLGGLPVDEDVVVWWSLVASSHEEVAAARAVWNGNGDGPTDGAGPFAGCALPPDRLLAPPLPDVRLRPADAAP